VFDPLLHPVRLALLPYTTGGGVVQMPPVQVPLRQSVPRLQALPSAHLPQLPPQSTSVSLPFRVPSLQVAAWQIPPEQTRLVQSAADPQLSPVAQL
jgi:hypothetical protein